MSIVLGFQQWTLGRPLMCQNMWATRRSLKVFVKITPELEGHLILRENPKIVDAEAEEKN